MVDAQLVCLDDNARENLKSQHEEDQYRERCLVTQEPPN